jgi:hypothetical protein
MAAAAAAMAAAAVDSGAAGAMTGEISRDIIV